MNRQNQLPLLLLALVLALAIKFAVYEGEALIQSDYPARVQIQIPEGLIRLGTLDPVQVQVRGSSSAMTQFNPVNLQVRPNVSINGPGFVEVTLEPNDVQLPDDIDAVKVEPNRLTIEVDREVTQTVPIVIQLTGEPAAGAQVIDKIARPATVEIIGPQSLLENITELVVSVSIERRAITFEERVTPVMPDPSVRLRQPIPVIVRITLQEPQLNIDLGDSETQETIS